MKRLFKYLLVGMMILNTVVLAKGSQNDLESLEKTFKVYKQFNLDGDLEKTVDYVYPPVFTLTPKKTLLEGFKRVKESGKMPKINAFDETIRTPLKRYDKGVYTSISYTMEMEMNMMPPVKKENKEEYAKVQKMLNNPEELKSYKSFMLQLLKNQMGKDTEVIAKKDSLIVDIKKSSNMLAINENGTGWTFVEPVPQMIEHLKKVLPKEIIDNEKEMFDVKVLTPEEQMAAMMELMTDKK